MSPRPPIFISAVSRELRSARQLVANTLTFLGYQPVWQEIFGTESGDLRAILRQQIDQCKGVVQIVGQCYCAEPPTPDEELGRVSYTQYEALYARERGKKVWYLFIGENFPADQCDTEPQELRELQAAYRRRLQADTHVFHPLISAEALEASVLKLRDDLTQLRRGVKQWATGVAVLLILLVALVTWLLRGQRETTQEVGATKDAVAKMTAEMSKMREGIMQYSRVETEVRGAQIEKERQDIQEQVYAELGKQLGIDPKILREKLPGFAEQLKRSPNASSYERANAAYVAHDYTEAERLSLQGADEARQANKVTDTIKALELAGLSAQKRIEYARAMEHFRAAEKLTDRERNPKDWAQLQHAIADLLIDHGKYAEAETLMRNFIELRTQLLGAEHPDTLSTRSNLGKVFTLRGKYAEAEAEHRSVLKLREKVLGPKHPDTLLSRYRWAGVLEDQGKYAEAEVEYRRVLQLREKVLGPEHPDTLRARRGLAGIFFSQSKYANAEAEHRSVLKLAEKVLGPTHPDTLNYRSGLADTLARQDKYPEAGQEYGLVLRLQEKVLGAEHPNTIHTRSALASMLGLAGKHVEAEGQYRNVIKEQEKVLGAEHPDTIYTRGNLAGTLEEQGKYEEAEAQCREVIKAQEKVLGAEHRTTLLTRNNLAWTLNSAGKRPEAEQEIRAVLAIMSRLYGTDDVETLACRDTLGEVLRAQQKFAEAELEFRATLNGLERSEVEDAWTLDVRFHLALCLRDENKFAEAKQFAQQAVYGARTKLGPNHPNTKKYEKLLQELETAK